jgi:hypothetical protein
MFASYTFVRNSDIIGHEVATPYAKRVTQRHELCGMWTVHSWLGISWWILWSNLGTLKRTATWAGDECSLATSHLSRVIYGSCCRSHQLSSAIMNSWTLNIVKVHCVGLWGNPTSIYWYEYQQPNCVTLLKIINFILTLRLCHTDHEKSTLRNAKLYILCEDCMRCEGNRSCHVIYEIFTAVTVNNVSYAMWRHVALVRTDVSEERITFIMSVKGISELGTTLAASSNLSTLEEIFFSLSPGPPLVQT